MIARAYPHVIAQLIRDRSPAMRSILSSLVLTHSGNIRWARLEQLIQEAHFTLAPDEVDELSVLSPSDIFSAASDAVEFLLSDRGSRVRYDSLHSSTVLPLFTCRFRSPILFVTGLLA